MKVLKMTIRTTSTPKQTITPPHHAYQNDKSYPNSVPLLIPRIPWCSSSPITTISPFFNAARKHIHCPGVLSRWIWTAFSDSAALILKFLARSYHSNLRPLMVQNAPRTETARMGNGSVCLISLIGMMRHGLRSSLVMTKMTKSI